MTMELLPVVLSFLGALGGGTVAALWNTKGTRRLRLEDAYADFASAADAMIAASMGVIFGNFGDTHRDTSNRFAFTRAKVLLQEHDQECRGAVVKLSEAIDALNMVKIRIDGGEETDREKVERSLAHFEKMKGVERQLLALIDLARSKVDPF